MSLNSLLPDAHPALIEGFEAISQAKGSLANAGSITRTNILHSLAELLRNNTERISTANSKDITNAKNNNMSEGLLDRLLLNEQRVLKLADALEDINSLPDPLGISLSGKILPNGIELSQISVPFGAVGAIYEARPNVTIDIVAMAIKTGNCVVLRGGSAAENTNEVLVSLVQEALVSHGLPAGCVFTVDPWGREGADCMMRARGVIDVLVPRGSAQLINTVVNNSKVPVLETGAGNVHIYIDEFVNENIVTPIIINAKTQRIGVCNAVETIVVHRAKLAFFVEQVLPELLSAGVQVRASDPYILTVNDVVPATNEDWATEYLDMIVAIKVVDSIDDAIKHVNKYSTKHTEAILTENMNNANLFMSQIDSAVVMLNTSTRFSDGGEFGFGAEIGIATQKMHARGPMGLNALTTYQWRLRGNGQIR